MNKKYLFLTIFILHLFSCNDSVKKTDIIGNWYLFSSDSEYSEFYIYKNELYLYSNYGGSLYSIPYLIKDDSLKYEIGEYKYSFKIVKLSDSEIILKNNEWSDTLQKLDDSILVFHKINWEDDKTFNNFKKQFDQRQYDAWINHGYITKEELLESFKDTVEIIEVELPLKRE